MGLRNKLVKGAEKAGDAVAKLSKLSPAQLEEVQSKRDGYLAEMAKDDPSSEDNLELAARLLAANSVEVFNSYLPQLADLYVPIDSRIEYGKTEAHPDAGTFDAYRNIRFYEISKWVTDRKESNLEKLVNVYDVLKNETCNIALVFHRAQDRVDAYIAVTNTRNDDDNNAANDFSRRLSDAVRGNFPGSKLGEVGHGRIPCLDDARPYSVACASNIPAEKSERFEAQTVEKLLDGIVPRSTGEEYTLILLATPILDVENRKLHLGDYYSGLAPYAQWQTNFTYTEADATGSMATFGVNVGASAGIQNGQTRGDAISHGDTQNESHTDTEMENEGVTDTETHAESENITHSEANGTSHTDNRSITVEEGREAGVNASVGVPGVFSIGANGSVSFSVSGTMGSSDTVSKTITEALSRGKSDAVSKALSRSTGRSIAQTLGRAVSDTVSKTAGVFSSTSLGANVGANFARSSTTNVAIGMNEGITQSFTNFNVKHALDLLEEQMRRMEESAALGMWEFAAYVLCEDANTANNVAHTYLALTQGEKSYMSQSAVNVWRGNTVRADERDTAREICSYLRDLRHPAFGLSPTVTTAEPYFNVYPPVVTATTNLTGKELALALNFPKRSLPGLPVIRCAEFGRSIVTYDPPRKHERHLPIGRVFHMHAEEPVDVWLTKNSLASHTFVTGSTGAGKTNTVCKIIAEATRAGAGFLVVEPAKGEYKDLIGSNEGVQVFGTNPNMAPLLHLNPFSFPQGVHVLEHLDRLVEVFNVCWPMYAAMPAVLKGALERSYADCGWDLVESENPYGADLWPTFDDVARNVRTLIDSSEYDAENKGAYKGSLLTRIESLTNGINGLIFSGEEIPASILFDGRAIADLSRVGSSETKSLIMGVLVLKLQEHRMATSAGPNSELRHLTVLEEAHNLLKRTSTEQPVEGGNLLGKSVEMISNSIAEMRTYGEGFVIADQAPGLLDMAAIRNTNTKVVMRLPDLADRELVGRAANLDDDQIAELARLPRGVAAIYQNEWIAPVLCKIDCFESAGGRFEYERPVKQNARDDRGQAVWIAEQIGAGVAFDEEALVRDVRPKLQALHIDASIQVGIMRLLAKPAAEPRMTKIAPFMAALFPDVRAAVVEAYEESSEPLMWTESAERALAASVGRQISDAVSRDIIQAVVTDYVLCELKRRDVLERWSEIGGFRWSRN
ncbi:MAG: DUF87 domain-containing protein [Eggerthellaceae bacterium]|nr:DUF87 domain-containing protein [Eggerthellaceae bacterium]